MENENNETPERIKEKNADTIKISGRLVLGVVIGIVIIIVAFSVLRGGDNTITGKVIQTGGAASFSESDIAAIVDGETITVGELNNAFNSLPPQYARTVTKEALLNQIVQAKVFYQEAEKRGLVLSDEEVRQQLELVRLSSGLSEEQFSANLAARGTTEEALMEQYRKQLTVQEFINVNLLDKIQISNEEIQEYYTNNLKRFQLEEQVVVKHILIGDEDLTPEERDAKAEELLSQLTQDNFCEYVNDYSTDAASLPTCGEYAFTRADAFVEEFKNLSFEQDAGDIGIVRTQFGPHIIWTVEKIPAQTIALEEASNQIGEFLRTQEGQEQYWEFYERLAEGSEIEIRYTGI